MSMTLRAAAIAVVLAASAATASAGTALQATLNVSAGVTDNAQSAPTETPPGGLGRQTDLISTITPSLILSTGGSRIVQRLTYTFNAILFARNTEADTYTNTLSWSAFFIPSKRSTFTLNALVSEGRQSSFSNLQDSASTEVQLRPPAILELLSIAAGQGFGYELTRNLRLIQSLAFTTSYLVGSGQLQATTQDAIGRVGLEYLFARDVVGGDVSVDYTNYPAVSGPLIAGAGQVDPNGSITPRQQQLSVTPLARWRRDLTYFMSLRAQLGAVVIFDPTSPSPVLAEPAGGLGFNFFGRSQTFDISYQHAATPNVLLRTTFLTDQALLRGNFALKEKSGFFLSLGAAYSYNRQVDLNATTGSIAHSISGDATLTYAPYRFLSFYLRYQVIDQIGRRTDPVPVLDFYQNTLLFGISAIYPPTVTLDVPSKPFGLRADGRDGPSILSSKSTSP